MLLYLFSIHLFRQLTYKIEHVMDPKDDEVRVEFSMTVKGKKKKAYVKFLKKLLMDTSIDINSY